jgi:GNAT superfamily N-acetyltransferase
MLTHIEAETLGEILPLLDRFPEKSVRISALLKAYGTGRDFFNVWIQDDGRAVVTRLDSNFTFLDLSGADYEEISFFLEFNPYFHRLIGETGQVERIAHAMTENCEISRCNLMRLHNANLLPPRTHEVMQNPPLTDVYALVSAEYELDANFELWYSDISHRIRHGCARTFLALGEHIPVSACLVSAESERAGLISCIVTRPEYRRRGYAGSLISTACRDLTDNGKIPVLECHDTRLAFYASLGFEKIADMAEITRQDF